MKRILFLVIPFMLTGCTPKNYSVGVIGGADGPTSIFVSSRIDPWMIGALIVIGIAAMIGICFRRKKKK